MYLSLVGKKNCETREVETLSNVWKKKQTRPEGQIN
jgi:hypothetical protein